MRTEPRFEWRTDLLPKSGKDHEFDAQVLADGLKRRQLLAEYRVEQDQAEHGDHLGEVVGDGDVRPGELEVDLAFVIRVEDLRNAFKRRRKKNCFLSEGFD